MSDITREKALELMQQIHCGYFPNLVCKPEELQALCNAVRADFAKELLGMDVEPVAHICILPTKDAGPTKFFTAPSDPRGFPVYTQATVLQELEKWKCDADRYRWLRDRLAIEDVETLIKEFWGTPDEEESLKTDAAIDAAIRNRKD